VGSKPHILVVDDEEFVRASMVEILAQERWTITAAGTGREAARILAGTDVDVVVSDLRMPAGDGLSVLGETRRLRPATPLILLTGAGSVETAVAAMRAGAYDFVQKPIDPDQLVRLVRRALEHRKLLLEVTDLRRAVGHLREPGEIIGRSALHQKLKSQIAQVARSMATVLVTGESGTGKELVALEVHRKSERADKNLVSVNCAAVTDSLFESEFFGHRRGAFTSAVADRSGRFAEASGGTLVLDEIGTLKLEMQAKLLRVLETGEYQVVGDSRTQVADVRVIAITNEDLAAAVRDGTFRADLYYRLAIFPIEVPPLRARKEDVVPIAEHFMARARFAHSLSAKDPGEPALLPDAVAVLSSYDWPGNVRELRNVLERAWLMSGSEGPTATTFREIVGAAPLRLSASPAPAVEELNLRLRVDALERDLILAALARAGGRKRDASAMLGIDPRNLGYYLRKHAITEDRGESRAPST
jgi:two-component system, NtrC family, response regulator AtoC